MIFRSSIVLTLIFAVQVTTAIKCPAKKICVLKSDCNMRNNDGFGLLNKRFGEDENCDLSKYTCCDEPKQDTPVAISPKCGFRASTFYGESLRQAEFGEFSWTVLISEVQKVDDRNLNVHLCGGSLIHPSVVLTASHCVHDKLPESLIIRAGEYDTQTEFEQFSHVDVKVKSYVVHPDYHKSALHRDVALIFLESPLKTAQNINFICLPPKDYNFTDKRCFASGWGKDIFGKDGKYQSVMQKIELPIVEHAECQSYLRKTRLGLKYKLDESFICAGGEAGRDTCSGFGGSPLVCAIPNDPLHYYQAGIVSWGIGCGDENVPGVYTNVALFSDWIDEQINLQGFEQDSYRYKL